MNQSAIKKTSITHSHSQHRDHFRRLGRETVRARDQEGPEQTVSDGFSMTVEVMNSRLPAQDQASQHAA